MPGVSHILELKGVTKAFGGVEALRDIDLSVPSNGIVGVIGPNGAGKSTLFNCVTGFHGIDMGEVWLSEQRIDGLRADQTNRLGMARTFQNTRPFATMTLLENVMVGALTRTNDVSAARRRAVELVGFVGLHSMAESRGSALSTGQRKRLEMARALATEPTVLLMDEVTGGVDPGAIGGLLELVRHIRDAGLTVLVIEHNMNVIRELSDVLVAMHLGRVIAAGHPDVVIRDEHVVNSYLGRDDAKS